MMVQHVRNFWVSASVDGRATPIAFGPQRADGGFELTVMMRDRGDILRAINVWGVVGTDGMLRLRAEGCNGTGEISIDCER